MKPSTLPIFLAILGVSAIVVCIGVNGDDRNRTIKKSRTRDNPLSSAAQISLSQDGPKNKPTRRAKTTKVVKLHYGNTSAEGASGKTTKTSKASGGNQKVVSKASKSNSMVRDDVNQPTTRSSIRTFSEENSMVKNSKGSNTKDTKSAKGTAKNNEFMYKKIKTVRNHPNSKTTEAPSYRYFFKKTEESEEDGKAIFSGNIETFSTRTEEPDEDTDEGDDYYYYYYDDATV